MTTQKSDDDRIALLQGNLDLLILKALVLGPCHGQGVARSIQRLKQIQKLGKRARSGGQSG